MLPIILFALAAVTGLAMAIPRFRGRPIPPLGLALAHGAFAATGLFFLIFSAFNSTANQLLGIALILFVVAALGGFALFSFHLRKKPLPIGLVGGHALLAVVAFVILLKATIA